MGQPRAPYSNRSQEKTSVASPITYSPPITWLQVVGAGNVTLKGEDGVAVTYTGCIGGEVYVGPFTELTSMTSAKVRLGDGTPPPPAVVVAAPPWTVLGPFTTTHTLVAGELAKIDVSAGVCTATLPTAVGIAGQRCAISDATGSAASHTITVATTSSQTVNGTTPATITVANTCRVYVSDGANWVIESLS